MTEYLRERSPDERLYALRTLDSVLWRIPRLAGGREKARG